MILLHKKTHKGLEEKKGFTIVESLVAISILMIAVLGPLVVVSQAFKVSFFARDQMNSFYLAQEAIEYVRNTRDRNSLVETDPNNWLNGIAVDGFGVPIAVVVNDIGASAPVKYQLVRSSGAYKLLRCPGTPSVCPKVRYTAASGLYGAETGGVFSVYTREVIFSKVPDDPTATQEVSVKVLMKWNQVGGTYQFPLYVHLTNWKIQNYNES